MQKFWWDFFCVKKNHSEEYSERRRGQAMEPRPGEQASQMQKLRAKPAKQLTNDIADRS